MPNQKNFTAKPKSSPGPEGKPRPRALWSLVEAAISAFQGFQRQGVGYTALLFSRTVKELPGPTMVRPFAAKGKKRKKTEKYDRSEEDDGESVAAPPKKPMVENELDEEPPKEDFHELEGIPVVPKDPRSDNTAGAIFVLERASLEVAKVGKVPIFYRFGVLGFHSIWVFFNSLFLNWVSNFQCFLVLIELPAVEFR